MNKINKLLLVAAAVFAMAGCYKDQGNYEYTTEDLDAVTISEKMYTNVADPTLSAFVFEFGDDVVIDANYEIVDKTLKDSDLSFEWLIAGETHTGSTLTLTDLLVGKYEAVLVITDNRYGTKYGSSVRFEVTPHYTAGWAVISEVGDASLLGYQAIDVNNSEDLNNPVFLDFEPDVYSKVNQGESLGLGVKHLSYHNNCDGGDFRLSIIQEDANESVDLRANYMDYETKMSADFIGGQAPEGLKAATYTKSFAYALTQEGGLYLRNEVVLANNAGITPHATQFPKSPIYTDGQTLNVEHIVDLSEPGCGLFAGTAMSLIGYDKNSGGLFHLQNGGVFFLGDMAVTGANQVGSDGTDGTNTYPDIKFPSVGDLSEYNVLAVGSTAVYGHAWYWFSGSFFQIPMLLERKSDGKQFMYTVEYDMQWGSYSLYLLSFFELPSDVVVDAGSIKSECGLDVQVPYFFFTANAGKDMYCYDLNTSKLQKVLSTSSEITSIDMGEVSYCYASLSVYNNKFAVGTQDGNLSVYHWDMEGTVEPFGAPLYQVNTGGPVTQIKYMSNNEYKF